MKRAPGAIAGRFLLDFPCENGILTFCPALGFGAAGRRRGGKAARPGKNPVFLLSLNIEARCLSLNSLI
ncbi:MAG: hypothetical protein Q7R35_17080 [Elusimicrobiota bacterium]|nr:hypothetical protein [Elusimicrobiota bacterium]